MRIAYFDCISGISGDMTLGALVDAGVELAAIQAGIDSLGMKPVRLVPNLGVKNPEPIHPPAPSTLPFPPVILPIDCRRRGPSRRRCTVLA